MPRKEKDTAERKAGGIAFFLSLFFLLLLAVTNTVQLPRLFFFPDAHAAQAVSAGDVLLRLVIFAAGAAAGAAATFFLLPSRGAVFIHELKHSIVSNLAGNKFKSMKVERHSGHFEYKYSKATAAYNAFISLAPYYLPLFTAVGGLAAAALFWRNHTAMAAVVALAYGGDCVLNARDVSPHQSDFANLRGGYQVGLIYVLAMNATILTFLLAWALRGVEGWLILLEGLWALLYAFYTKGS